MLLSFDGGLLLVRAAARGWRLTYNVAGQCLHSGHSSEGLRLLLFCHLGLGFKSIATPLLQGPDPSYAIILLSCFEAYSESAGLRMEERDFFDEKEQKKPYTLNCPHCHQAAEYDISWLVRTKKRQLPGRADERDKAKFAKAKSYMVRKDDLMMCKNMRCRKRFEIAGVQSVAFLE